MITETCSTSSDFKEANRLLLLFNMEASEVPLQQINNLLSKSKFSPIPWQLTTTFLKTEITILITNMDSETTITELISTLTTSTLVIVRISRTVSEDTLTLSLDFLLVQQNSITIQLLDILQISLLHNINHLQVLPYLIIQWIKDTIHHSNKLTDLQRLTTFLKDNNNMVVMDWEEMDLLLLQLISILLLN